MLRKIVVVAALSAVVGIVSPAIAGACKGCAKVASSGEGFCCDKGIAFGVPVSSKKLSEALAGVEVDPGSIKCAGCKSAASSNGQCDHCKVGIVDGKAYRSMVAYHLAKGKLLPKDAKIKCPDCAKAKGSDGFCKECKAGFAAGRLYKTEPDYKAALAAHETLVKAADVAGKCEACAVAMVTDGECASCKAKFKDGKKVAGK